MNGERVGVDPVILANEFAEVMIAKVQTRNGERLMIRAPRSQRTVLLCPLELEALTWQTPEVFSTMIGHPGSPMTEQDEE